MVNADARHRGATAMARNAPDAARAVSTGPAVRQDVRFFRDRARRGSAGDWGEIPHRSYRAPPLTRGMLRECRREDALMTAARMRIEIFVQARE
jgi:hypothetical protein